LLEEDGNPRDVLLKIDGVNYKFKKDIAQAMNRRFVGYIAQQVESVVPDAVQLIDGILHVDYESLIPYLSESIRANYNDIKNIKSATDKLTLVVDSLYDQFLKQSKFSVSEIESQDTIKTQSPKAKISKLWYAVIATVCVLGLVGGLAVALLVPFNEQPEAVPLQPYTPTEDSLANLDMEGLVEFYHATNGQYWHKNDGWLKYPDVCTWFGVVCTDWSDRVVELQLGSNNLAGTIPSNISKLAHVRVIVLSNNTLHGTVPKEITSLKELKRLDLNYNELQGTIPENIGSMPLLRVLYMKHNNISGKLPYSLAESSSIRDLDLAGNMIGGFLPDFIVSSPMRFLDLSFNQFVGDLPVFGTAMSHLYLEDNQLAGPTWKLESLPQIEVINVGNNRLTGEFRLTEAQYRQVSMLIIAENRFTSFSADGIQNWKARVLCDISHNNFTCPLDTVVSQRCYNSCA
jgi:Leucine-rich repeat (LRR) protein